jgi:hypothetical protein
MYVQHPSAFDFKRRHVVFNSRRCSDFDFDFDFGFGFGSGFGFEKKKACRFHFQF